MENNSKEIQIFKYLHSIKANNSKRIRNINEYEEIFYENEVSNLIGVTQIQSEDNDKWIEISKEAKELYKVFSKLFLKLEKNSESLEVVYGHGLLVGKFGDVEVNHPIFTTKMDLSFQEKKGLFTLEPYNNVTNVELDILYDLDFQRCKGSENKVSLESILEASSKVKAMGVNPRREEEVKAALKVLGEALELTSVTEYEKVQSLLQLEGGIEIKVYNEPVIILRKVDTRLWNLELTSMIEKLQKGIKVPKVVKALVTEEKLQIPEEEVLKWKELKEELLFPLPYNEEQKEIAKKLSDNFGLVVQGPPGTGKSHTIVNLICHLLAHGKRVLVTSETDRALKVLNSKIPEGIRALCMSILGDDSKAMEDLDESVRKITENLALDTGELKKQVKELKYRLRQNKENQNRLIEELKKVYDKENQKISYQEKDYTIAEVAKFVREEKEAVGYIEDFIALGEENIPNNEEVEKLVQLLENHSKEVVDFYEEIKEYVNKLPNLKELNTNMENYKNLVKDIYVHRGIVSEWGNRENTSFTNSNLINSIDLAITTLERYEDTLMEGILASIHEDSETRKFWSEYVKNLKEDIAKVYKLRARLNRYKVTLPEAVDMTKLRKDFQIVYEEISSKGKIGVFFKMLHKNINYILQDILIDEEKLSSVEQINVLKDYLDLVKLEKEIKNYYNAAVKEYNEKLLIEEEPDFIKVIQEFTLEVENLLDFEEMHKNKVLNLLKVKHFNKELNFYKKETYIYLREVLNSQRVIKEFEGYEKNIEEAKRQLGKFAALRKLTLKVEEFNMDYLKKFIVSLQYCLNYERELEYIIELRDKLTLICPKFTKRLVENREKIRISDNFQEAVKYSVFNTYINNILNIDVRAIEKELNEEKIKQSKIVGEIIYKQSWYNQILRTSEAQKRSLVTWMEAIKRIGKGTGAQVMKYRKIAQKEMENCKDIIPVWIMPINRVIENLKVNEDLFDVVIVDESSQSDLSALSVLMRAERAVIVGDEKQISPEAIGKSNEKVEELIDIYLKDIPHKEWFDLKTSLYNTALRVFPDRLVLKEHFRSLEEIIGFSNNLCYSQEIVPLKPGGDASKLGSSLVTVKVDEGFKDESKSINIKEAYEIVEAISNCCKNPLYSNMTMGVISLLGESQAELIENMLIEKIGMEEIVRRNLVCGDAYSFQGDERDVMFLSMVVGNNAKFATLSKDSDLRRFNVAASRARSQMWLFHSVDLEDLNAKCVRGKLLFYMLNHNESIKNQEAAATLLLSPFEEDVRKELIEEKLNIASHYRIGKYTMDFVVEGRKKLAIKLIGDKKELYPSFEEQYKEEYTLERAGWKFLKIRSSEFYLNCKEVINNIKEKIY